ncbi:MAG TPA: hypothetical protein VF803_02740 [Candidatus Paceibacterota bacterium]
MRNSFESGPFGAPKVPAQEKVQQVDENSFEGIVESQLAISETRYRGALEKLRQGDLSDLDYLQDMKANLVGYINDFNIKYGALTPGRAEAKRKVSERLAELQSVLKNTAH